MSLRGSCPRCSLPQACESRRALGGGDGVVWTLGPDTLCPALSIMQNHRCWAVAGTSGHQPVRWCLLFPSPWDLRSQ